MLSDAPLLVTVMRYGPNVLRPRTPRKPAALDMKSMALLPTDVIEELVTASARPVLLTCLLVQIPRVVIPILGRLSQRVRVRKLIGPNYMLMSALVVGGYIRVLPRSVP